MRQDKVDTLHDDTLSTTDNNTFVEIQAAYGASCSRYEEKASSKLANSDTIIISGYGGSITVRNGALRIYPGRTHKDQQQDIAILYNGVHGIKNIILLSDKGLISLDAVRWAVEQGITITMIDGRGNLMQSLTPEHESYATLRRAQYQAVDTGLAQYLSREIIRSKTLAQIDVLKTLPVREQDVQSVVFMGQRIVLPGSHGRLPGEPIWKPLDDGLTELPHMKEIETIRALEGRLAIIYWDAFIGIPIQWDRKSVQKVPTHWQRITERVSALSGRINAQRATNPYQAVTNYAYAILESQCRQSLNTQGFDPACGFLHADVLHRDSLVFDVMDAGLRPKVDQLVLKLFASTTFTKGDLMSAKTGEVIFNPQFSRYVAAACRIPQEEVDNSVLWLKSQLLGF
jgi:CRISPR-associated protein Cas1